MANKYAVGVYATESGAVSAINRLLESGYEQTEISVLAKDPSRFETVEDMTDVEVETTKAVGRSAGTGAAAGGVLGGIGGLLIGLGTLAIPGIGPFLAAGPLATALGAIAVSTPVAAAIGGAAAGGAAGGIIGALAGLGIEKSEAKEYEAALERGDLLVMVEADESRYDRVNDIFTYSDDEYYQRYGREDTLNTDALGRRKPHNVIDPIDPVGLDPNDRRKDPLL